jgi:hypothetical protein
MRSSDSWSRHKRARGGSISGGGGAPLVCAGTPLGCATSGRGSLPSRHPPSRRRESAPSGTAAGTSPSWWRCASRRWRPRCACLLARASIVTAAIAAECQGNARAMHTQGERERERAHAGAAPTPARWHPTAPSNQRTCRAHSGGRDHLQLRCEVATLEERGLDPLGLVLLALLRRCELRRALLLPLGRGRLGALRRWRLATLAVAAAPVVVGRGRHAPPSRRPRPVPSVPAGGSEGRERGRLIWRGRSSLTRQQIKF